MRTNKFQSNINNGRNRTTNCHFYSEAKKNVPDRLLDFGLSCIMETGNLTVNSSRYSNGRYSNGRPPLEIITGETQDVSLYLDFGFYDWATYRTNAGLG
mmetsp:Transcript_4294/g.6294  ORF Transcript_4294/g.6294 Transcript_4294/m.6294 type:complete len:99 (-) Transcript_4294:357-653(-)